YYLPPSQFQKCTCDFFASGVWTMWSSRVGKLQEVEGIIKGMLMTLDIRIGTDIVVIKSSLYVKMQLQQKLPLLIFSS
ncbi:hypothetical protein ACUCLB_004364, partial [Shigella dysenteriae]